MQIKTSRQVGHKADKSDRADRCKDWLTDGRTDRHMYILRGPGEAHRQTDRDTHAEHLAKAKLICLQMILFGDRTWEDRKLLAQERERTRENGSCKLTE